MITKISIIIGFLLIICGISTADNYIIDGDTVYIDDSKVYLSANPHTLSSSGWVYFNLTSKVYMGNIDACWGFNTSVSKPTKAEVYSTHWINTTTNHEKTFYNVSFIVYTGNDLDYGNSYNTNYRYTITESIVNENGTTYIMSNASFDSYITDGTNYTIYWYTRHDNYYLWKDFSLSFNSIIYDYEGYNKWYYIKNIPIASNKEYTVRAWIDVPVSTEKQFGKYYFAIKPSHETIADAVSNGHFYNLDPWWNAIWSHRKEIILTGGTSGAQTDYQVLLNVTYESGMQSDFDDLRFCNESHQLDAWLESKVDSSYALVWVEFPTTPANGVNQMYYMYYGNAEAVNDWDIGATFLFGDDAESGIYSDKWVDIIGTGEYSTDESYRGTKSIKFSDTDDQTSVSKDINVADGVFEAMVKTDDIHAAFTARAAQSALTYYAYRPDYTGDKAQLHSRISGSWVLEDEDVVGDNVTIWHKWSILCSGTSIKTYFNDALRNEATDNTISSGGLGTRGTTGGTTPYYDNVRIRKYAANPPTYEFGSEEFFLYIPPDIVTLANTTGNFWVHHTWSAGSGNMTDGYNVSVNSVWHNDTDTFYNDTYTAHAWQNITVWAYNSTGISALSSGSVSQNMQIPNNAITITNTSDWNGDAGETVYVDYDATDIDSDTATFSCDRTDLFTDFDTSTGTGNWTATANIYYVDFGVSDGCGSSSNYTMTLRELSIKNGLIAEVKLIMSETILGLKSINMGNYLVYAFILIGILLIIFLIRILNNCIYGE